MADGLKSRAISRRQCYLWCRRGVLAAACLVFAVLLWPAQVLFIVVGGFRRGRHSTPPAFQTPARTRSGRLFGCTFCAAGPAEEQPENRPHNGEEDDDNNPQPLGEGARIGGRCAGGIQQGVQAQPNHQRERADYHHRSCHALSLPQESWGRIHAAARLVGMNFFKYTLVRFGLLVFFFYLYELLGAGILVSGSCAIVSAFAVAYIFFPRLHAAASQDTARFFKRTPKVKNKEEEENRAIEDELVESQKKESGEDF